MKQVLFDRLQTNLAQCINDGTIYFVKDSNGNFTQISLGDGSKSHVVGIGTKMDDATKRELMSKLGLTISSDMGTIHLGKLSNFNGVYSQKVVIYENPITGTDKSEIANVGYVQQYMKAAQALVYAGLLNASTGEISSYNSALIPEPSEGKHTLSSLLAGYEGESYLKVGMAFIVGTGGKLDGDNYTYIQVQGGELNVEVGDMIIITDVSHVDTEGDTPAHNKASIIIVQNNLNIFAGSSSSDSDWQNGEGVTKAKQVYAFVKRYVTDALNGDIPALKAFGEKLTEIENGLKTVEGRVTTVEGTVRDISTKLEAGEYSPKWSDE